jgi:hypothetical protein
LLRILNPEIEFDWLANCEDPSLRTEEEYTNDYDTTFAIVPILYPNPVNNILNISGLSGKEKIIIYNTQSQILKEMIAIGNQIAISTHDLSNGVYTLSILSIESTVVKKFVVIR